MAKNARYSSAYPSIRKSDGRASTGRAGSDADDVRGVQPLLARLDLELHGLALCERLEAVHPNRREMHEHVVAGLLLDEAVPLRVVEPLHASLGHRPVSVESPR